MKSCCFCLSCIIFLMYMDTCEAQSCDRNTGPAGVTYCFGAAEYDSTYQCGTCLADTYVRQITKGAFHCRDNATYCYHQCMLEKHNLTEGPVYDDCLCDPTVKLPRPSVILPPTCYSPDGTDCGWYRQCLARMFDCTGHAEYAISYGEKFCKLYDHSKSKFSQKGLRWIDATRKCLQVALVPFLRLCQVQPTCEDIKTKAFHSHIDCYFKPYPNISVCYISPKDWYYIAWTIKGSFASEFLESMKALFVVGGKCAGSYISKVAEKLGKILHYIDVWLTQNIVDKRAADDVLSDDELAHSIVFRISSSLHWDQQSTMDWFAFAAETSAVENPSTTPSTDQRRRELRIQVIGLNSSACFFCLSVRFCWFSAVNVVYNKQSSVRL